MRPIAPLPSFSNVGAGNTVTVNIPVGRTQDQLTLIQGGTTFTRAQLENIELLANGKPIVQVSDGDRLDKLNDFYGRSDTADFLTLYFRRPEMVSLKDQRVTALGTSDVSTLQLRADIAAGAVAPTLEGHVVQSEPQPLGLIVKVKEFNYNIGGAGVFEISDLPKGPRIMALHFMKADITDVEVELDSRKVTDASKTLLEVIQKEHGRVPQTASATHVDYCLEGDISQALITQGIQDLRIRLTAGSAGALPLVVEYLDGFEGL